MVRVRSSTSRPVSGLLTSASVVSVTMPRREYRTSPSHVYTVYEFSRGRLLTGGRFADGVSDREALPPHPPVRRLRRARPVVLGRVQGPWRLASRPGGALSRDREARRRPGRPG